MLTNLSNPGLPVRQWRQEWVNIEPPPMPTTNQKNDRWAAELPWGMPKDTHLLPQHSQELLRAARSGRIYKRKAPADEEDVSEPIEPASNAPGATSGTPALVSTAAVPNGGEAEKSGEMKETGTSKAKDGVWVKVWKRLPRDAEAPTISRLAKRPKNLIVLPSKASTAQFSGPTVTRVTVRRVDAAGNSYEQTVTVNDDTKLSQIDGEIVSTTTIAAPATVEPLVQQQATPVKRRPPPPPHRKKHKGPGRGRKKKLGFLPIPLPAKSADATKPSGSLGDGANGAMNESLGGGMKPEDGRGTNEDIEMADNSQLASDDEDDEEDDGEEGEEGEDEEMKDEGMADDDDGGDAMADTTTGARSQGDQDQDMEDAEDDIRDAIQPSSIEEPTEEKPPVDEETEVITNPHLYPPSNPMSTVPSHPGVSHILTRQQEGSPLKNVVLPSPTEAKPMDFPTTAEAGQSEAINAEPNKAQQAASPSTEEKNASYPDLPAEKTDPPTTDPPPSGESHNLLPDLREPPKVAASSALSECLGDREMAEEDGGLDLLGGLERELDRQSMTHSTTPADAAVHDPGNGEQPATGGDVQQA